MPTYEYECRACGYTFERTQNMSDEPIRVCPECGKDVRRLIFGGSGVIFKGSGFYVNDSRGKNPAAPAGSKTPGTEGAVSSKKADASPSVPSGATAAASSASKGDTGKTTAIKETA